MVCFDNISQIIEFKLIGNNNLVIDFPFYVKKKKKQNKKLTAITKC